MPEIKPSKEQVRAIGLAVSNFANIKLREDTLEAIEQIDLSVEDKRILMFEQHKMSSTLSGLSFYTSLSYDKALAACKELVEKFKGLTNAAPKTAIQQAMFRVYSSLLSFLIPLSEQIENYKRISTSNNGASNPFITSELTDTPHTELSYENLLAKFTTIDEIRKLVEFVSLELGAYEVELPAPDIGENIPLAKETARIYLEEAKERFQVRSMLGDQVDNGVGEEKKLELYDEDSNLNGFALVTTSELFFPGLYKISPYDPQGNNFLVWNKFYHLYPGANKWPQNADGDIGKIYDFLVSLARNPESIVMIGENQVQARQLVKLKKSGAYRRWLPAFNIELVSQLIEEQLEFKQKLQPPPEGYVSLQSYVRCGFGGDEVEATAFIYRLAHELLINDRLLATTLAQVDIPAKLSPVVIARTQRPNSYLSHQTFESPAVRPGQNCRDLFFHPNLKPALDRYLHHLKRNNFTWLSLNEVSTWLSLPKNTPGLRETLIQYRDADPYRIISVKDASGKSHELPAYFVIRSNRASSLSIMDLGEGLNEIFTPDVLRRLERTFDRLSSFVSIRNSSLGSNNRNGEGSNCFQHDSRTFRQIMLDWEVYVQKVDSDQFLNHLGLTNTNETIEQLENMLHGIAAPSRELTAHIVNQLPEQVASKSVFNYAAENSRKICQRQVDILPSRYTRYANLSFPLVQAPPGENIGSEFYVKLQSRLKEVVTQTGREYDEKVCITDLATSLGVDPWVLQGFVPVPAYISIDDLANDLAQLLYADHDAHNEFREKAQEFYESKTGIAITAAVKYGVERNPGEIIFILRENADLSASRFASLIPITRSRRKLDAAKVYNIEKSNASILDEVLIFAMLRALGIDLNTATELASKVWKEHDKYWNSRADNPSNQNEEFWISRELAHISRHELAIALISAEDLPPSVNINSAIDRIAAFEAGTAATSEDLAIFERALKEARLNRAENFNIRIGNYTPPGEVIKQRRRELGLKQEQLAQKIVSLCVGRAFWNNPDSVQQIISKAESGDYIPQEREKLEIVATALGYAQGEQQGFIDVCLSRERTFWEAELKLAKNQGAVFKALRHLNSPLDSLAAFAENHWNERAAGLWVNIEAFKRSILQFENFGIPPKDDTQLYFLASSVGLATNDEIEAFVIKCREKHIAYWTKQYTEAENFGQAIHALRKLHYLTLEEMCTAMNAGVESSISSANLLSWENNKTKPQEKSFNLLCEFFEVKNIGHFRKLWVTPAEKSEAAEEFAERQSVIYDRYGRELAARLTAYMERETVLRPKQKKVNHDLLAHLADGKAAGYIKRPTGTGKTITFGSQIIAFNTPVGATEPVWDMPTIVLAPRKLLAGQNAKGLIKKLGIPEDKIGIYHSDMGKKAKTHALAAPVLMSTYDSARKGGIDLSRYCVGVLDEIHTGKGELTVPMVGEISSNSFTVGWTATDTFIINGAFKHIGQFLFAGNGPLHETSFREAVIDGEIAPTKNFVYEANTNVDLPDSGADDFTQGERERVVSIEGRDEGIIQAFAEARDEETNENLRDMISVWYHEGITAAKEFAGKMNKVFGEGYAVAVWGNMPKKERDDIIARQEKGEIMAVVNADLLGLGWDSPKTRVCGIVKPCKSPSNMEQMGGRVARLDPDNPDKISYVLNFLDKKLYKSITFAQVVDGANLIPANFRLRAKSRGEDSETAPSSAQTSYEPEAKLLTKITIKAYYTIREIIGFLQKREAEQRENQIEQLPETKQHWLPTSRVMAELGISSYGSPADQIAALYKTWHENPDTEITYEDKTNTASEIYGRYSRKGHSSDYIDPAIIPVLQKIVRLSRTATSKTLWVTGLKACKLLGIEENAENSEKIDAACKKLLQENRILPLHPTKFYTASRTPVEYYAGQLIEFREHRGYRKFSFDPVLKDIILAEIGVPKEIPKLPQEKSHWITVSQACRLLRLHLPAENANANRSALKSICKKLLAENGSIGPYKVKDVMGIYTNSGATGSAIYFDPKLIKEKVITKEMIASELKILIPDVLDEFSPAPGLLAAKKGDFFTLQRIYTEIERQMPSGLAVGELFEAEYKTKNETHKVKAKREVVSEGGEKWVFAETEAVLSVMAAIENEKVHTSRKIAKSK